jgi:hypothetical protein
METNHKQQRSSNVVCSWETHFGRIFRFSVPTKTAPKIKGWALPKCESESMRLKIFGNFFETQPKIHFCGFCSTTENHVTPHCTPAILGDYGGKMNNQCS